MNKLIKLIGVVTLTASTFCANLVWDRNPEPNVNRYRVHIFTAAKTNTVLVSTNSHPLTNLVAGIQHTFAVTALNTNNLESELSDTVSFIPVVGIPPAPVTTLLGVVNNGTTWSTSFSWQNYGPEYVVQGYYIRVVQNGVLYTNIFTTSLAATVVTPPVSPTTILLAATNSLGLSPYTTAVILERPGKSQNIKIVFP